VINQNTFDRFSLVHAALGFAIGKTKTPPDLAILGAVFSN
jgi:hypothetical protein